MTDALQTDWLTWLIRGALALALVVIWWGLRAYRADMKAREEKREKAQEERDRRLEARDEALQGCISNLEKSIWGLRDVYVLQKEYDRHLEQFHMGRRATDPILSDSGAKGLEHLRALGRAAGEGLKP